MYVYRINLISVENVEIYYPFICLSQHQYISLNIDIQSNNPERVCLYNITQL